LGRTPGVCRVFINGGSDAQTIRLEGNIYGRTLGGSGIIVSYAGSKRIGAGLEEPFFGQLSSVKARFPRRGAAVLAGELAGLPWSAIDLSRLKLHAAGKGRARKPEPVLSCLAGRTPVNLPHGLPGSRFEYRPASQSLSLRSLNATEQDKKTLEQFDEPFAG
jgi:hypothetical protein